MSRAIYSFLLVLAFTVVATGGSHAQHDWRSEYTCSLCESSLCDESGKLASFDTVDIEAVDVGLDSSYGALKCLVPKSCDELATAKGARALMSGENSVVHVQPCRGHLSPRTTQSLLSSPSTVIVDSSEPGAPWLVHHLSDALMCMNGARVGLCTARSAKDHALPTSCQAVTSLNSPSGAASTCGSQFVIKSERVLRRRSCHEHDSPPPGPAPANGTSLSGGGEDQGPPLPPPQNGTAGGNDGPSPPPPGGDGPPPPPTTSSSSLVALGGHHGSRGSHVKDHGHDDDCPAYGGGKTGDKNAPPCRPQCGQRECGSDGCGGQCGHCPFPSRCARFGGWVKCADPMWHHKLKKKRHPFRPRSPELTHIPLNKEIGDGDESNGPSGDDGDHVGSIEFVPEDMFGGKDDTEAEVVISPASETIVPGFNASHIVSAVVDITPTVGISDAKGYAVLSLNVTLPFDVGTDDLCLAYVKNGQWVCQDREPSWVISNDGQVSQGRGVTDHFSVWAIVDATAIEPQEAVAGGAPLAPSGTPTPAPAQGDTSGVESQKTEGGDNSTTSGSTWWIALLIVGIVGSGLAAAAVIAHRKRQQSSIALPQHDTHSFDDETALSSSTALQPISPHDAMPQLGHERPAREPEYDASPQNIEVSIEDTHMATEFNGNDSVGGQQSLSGSGGASRFYDIANMSGITTMMMTSPSAPLQYGGGQYPGGFGGGFGNSQYGVHQVPVAPGMGMPPPMWASHSLVPDAMDVSSSEDETAEPAVEAEPRVDDFSKSLNGLIGFMSTGNAKRFAKPRKQHTVENAENSLRLSKSAGKKQKMNLTDILSQNKAAHDSDEEM